MTFFWLSKYLNLDQLYQSGGVDVLKKFLLKMRENENLAQILRIFDKISREIFNPIRTYTQLIV